MAPKDNTAKTSAKPKASTADSAPQAVKTTRIRKITTGILWGKGEIKKRAKLAAKVCAEEKKPLADGEFLVMRITGRVIGSTIIEHPQYGESTRMIGSFVALSGKDQKLYQSNTLFLPGFMERDIMVLFSEHGAGVGFGYDLTARPREADEVNDQPFEYVSYPLDEDAHSANDLVAQINDKPSPFLALAAPSPADEREKEPA